ncbi:tyrosine--tRNA ligase [Patescibacteria group bacterium]
MAINTDEKEIDGILDRGVIVEVLPSKEDFRKKLLSGERLKFYIGFDPTSASLHLSHAKNIILLEEFRQLGHDVVLLFGDFTARIGDPTDCVMTRKQFSKEEILKNVEKWKKQVEPLMDFEAKQNPPRILYNSEWLSKLTFEEVTNLASSFTVQQMLERDMFEKRMKANKPIYLHEFLYPLMQGYDSVEMEVDVEMCGTDQIFNALVGRTLLKKFKNKEKFVLAVNLMENPKTKELMSKSRGTGVFLDSIPSEMFGAIMAQPDEMIEIFLINITMLELDEIKEILKEKLMEAKKRTAFEIVKIFHGEEEAKKAQESFKEVFQNKKLPDDINSVEAEKGKELKDVFVEAGVVSSASEFRRLIKDGAIEFNGEVAKDIHYKIEKSGVVRIGKKKFVKLELK